MTARYELVDQVHYLEDGDDGSERLVTVQRWDARRAPARRSLFVLAHDGRQIGSKECRSATELQLCDLAMAAARLTPRPQLSEAQARSRPGIPADEGCRNRLCGGGIPIAATRCEFGHSTGRVSAGGWTGMRHRDLRLPPAGPSGE